MKKLLVIVEILNHVGGLTHSIRPAAVTHVECIFRELLTELHSPLADNDGCLCFSNRQMEVESNTWWKTRDDRFIQVLGNKTQSPFDCEEIKRRPSGVKLRMNSFLSITTTLRLWSMNRSFHTVMATERTPVWTTGRLPLLLDQYKIDSQLFCSCSHWAK